MGLLLQKRYDLIVEMNRKQKWSIKSSIIVQTAEKKQENCMNGISNKMQMTIACPFLMYYNWTKIFLKLYFFTQVIQLDVPWTWKAIIGVWLFSQIQ